MDPVIARALQRVRSCRWHRALMERVDPNDSRDCEGTVTVLRASKSPELVADVLARVLPRLKERR